jgi:Fe(3+) dicitrate transport protein
MSSPYPGSSYRPIRVRRHRATHLARASSLAAAVAAAMSASPNAFADDTQPSEELRRLPTIVVVGQADGDIERQPGAVSLVTPETLRLQQPRSTEEALRAVPGVAIKPEEESAIVANIGIRGLSSADYKTLILEDGVPVAPGLFVGNARYYNPRIQRMDGIEVLRGAASLRYGPGTIGGVINYITRDPRDGVELGVRAGSFGAREATVELGGSSQSGDARFGMFVTRADSNGFMDKSYDMTDVLIKAGLDVGASQRLSMKYTDYSNDANISYRGLLLGEYLAGASHNPAPDDWFLIGRRSLDLNHEWRIGNNTRLNTLVYGSEMFRDYWRYGTDNTASGQAGRWVYTDSLQGNNRSFDRFGVDSRLHVTHHRFGVLNESELGLRYMTETMYDQTIAATRETPRSGNLNRDRVDSADSVALYAQNRFLVTDRTAVTVGLRAERYEQRRNDRQVPLSERNLAATSNSEVMPGVGVTYQPSAPFQFFANIYRAFSPALNGDALSGLQDQQLDAERSWNAEAGLRGRQGRFTYEMTLFHMDFDNQIIPANSNSDFQVTNGGRTLHQGLEAGTSVEIGAGFSVNANFTHIPTARFEENRFDRNDELTTPEGHRIPYTPEWTANLGVVHHTGSLRTGLYIHRTGAQYTDVMNTREISENLSGFFTGRIPAYSVIDMSMSYDVNRQLNVGGAIRNIANERYISSLRQGIYVGPERSVDIGVRYRF